MNYFEDNYHRNLGCYYADITSEIVYISETFVRNNINIGIDAYEVTTFIQNYAYYKFTDTSNKVEEYINSLLHIINQNVDSLPDSSKYTIRKHVKFLNSLMNVMFRNNLLKTSHAYEYEGLIQNLKNEIFSNQKTFISSFKQGSNKELNQYNQETLF